MPLVVKTPADLLGLVGTEGPPMAENRAGRVDGFAEITGDHQWIRVDVERARPAFGGTIAHGCLTMSLVACSSPDWLRCATSPNTVNVQAGPAALPRARQGRQPDHAISELVSAEDQGAIRAVVR